MTARPEEQSKAEPVPTEKPREPMLAQREEKREGLLGRISSGIGGLFAKRVSERFKVTVTLVSTILGLSLAMVATFVYPRFQTRPAYDNAMVLIIIITMIPPSIVDLVDRTYRQRVDSRIPDFLRNVSEAQKTGLSFMRSLQSAAQAEYGLLTLELKKAMAKLSWGLSYEDALNYFARSVDTALAHRVAVLLSEVGRSGGKMLEVLDSVYEHVREVISLQRERRRQLSAYIMVIYASFGVYLFVVYILFTTFFAEISKLIGTGAPFGVNVNPAVYYIWFFHLSIIEALIGGLLIGKISEGSASAGTKHILVLLIISLITFSFFIKV